MTHQFRESRQPRCPPGYVLRKAYTTKNGTYVPARCIIERGVLPKPTNDEVKRNMNMMDKIEKEIKHVCNENECPKSCPKGQILKNGYKRNAYTKEDGTYVEATIVPPTCIEDIGKPGKGPKLIQFSKNDHILSNHGYIEIKDKTVDERHRILIKVIKALTRDYGHRAALGYVIKALNARSIVERTGSPESSKAMKEDQVWVSGLLKEWKEKHPDDKGTKKKMRLILLDDDHFLSEHGYKEITSLKLEQRRRILRKVLKDLRDLNGDKEGFLKLIKLLNARANIGMTTSPESSKLFKEDADWVSGLYAEWKEKHPDAKNKKGARIKLVEEKKKSNSRYELSD